MVSLLLSDDLLRAARDAVSAPVIRDAVRDLALHALRSRSLTASHIAAVARTLGEGIESCTLAPAAPVREVQRGAWQGLAEAVDQALYACELAARDLDEDWTHFPPSEREKVIREFEEMERALAGGCAGERLLTRELGARMAAVIALLRLCGTGSAGGAGSGGGATVADARLFAMVATGVLLGLTAAPRAALAS